MSHTVTVHFEDRATPVPPYDLACTEPADAPCKATWDCECEGYFNYKVRDGKPTHTADSSTAGERCVGRFTPGACNVGEWFDTDDSLSGEITFDVHPEWDGDGINFRIVGGGVTR